MSQGTPAVPYHPAKGSSGGSAGREARGWLAPIAPPHFPPPPTYGFAILAGIALGMAERGEVSVQAGMGAGRGDTQ